MTLFRSAADAHDLGAPLVRLFVTALARVPDRAGLLALVTQRRSGESLATIAAAIVALPEFLARHGPAGPPDAHYLRALFWAADGQDPSDADSGLLVPEATRATVLLAVSQSARAHAGISLAANLYPGGLPPDDDVAYQLWLGANRDRPEDAVAQARHAATLPAALFSVILIVPDARPDLVAESVASVAAQLWPHWECLLVCQPTLPPHVRAAIATLVAKTPALALIDAPSGPPAALANLALAQARGTMFAWIDASDRLAPLALYYAAATRAAVPARLLYTDEDWIAGDGTRFNPALKPAWSPDLALTGDAFGQLTLFDREAAQAQGGFSPEAAPFERYDLALRLVHDAPPGAIRHIPAILFHRGRRRPAGPAGFPACCATSATPKLAELAASHLQGHHPGLALGERRQGSFLWPTLTAALPSPAPRVSVIIPVRDHPGLLETCLEGLLTKTDYPDLEILVVDNGSETPEMLHLLQRAQHDPRVRVLPQSGAFNWSALNNAGARAATGEILLLLNNDIEVVEPGWLAIMAGHVLRPGIGIVGARLLFPDGTLQHGGVLLGPRGQAVHAMTHASAGDPGYLGQTALPRDLSAVTGACLAIRRSVFDEAGGLDAGALRVAWSDIALCLAVRQAGYRVLWLPDAVLIHREMATRGRDATLTQRARHEIERAALRRRFPEALDRDPFLNPNLDATATGIVLADPPRPLPPWPDAGEAAA